MSLSGFVFALTTLRCVHVPRRNQVLGPMPSLRHLTLRTAPTTSTPNCILAVLPSSSLTILMRDSDAGF